MPAIKGSPSRETEKYAGNGRPAETNPPLPGMAKSREVNALHHPFQDAVGLLFGDA